MAKRRIADLYEIKCSACGAPLKVQEGELIICPYCGTQFAFEDFEEEEEEKPRPIYNNYYIANTGSSRHTTGLLGLIIAAFLLFMLFNS